MLDDVSFDVQPNDYVCIVGHNGSGKSTISKVIAGIVKPKEGNIYIDNQKLTYKNLLPLRKKIGFIFQNPDNQFIGITTEDDIAFGLENYKVRSEKMQFLIKNVAGVVDITNLLKKEASDLSGGQKQKVAISSVLVLTPEIIIFDESTSMLDPYAKLQIKALMKQLQTSYNRTIISITHDMEELKNATKILCMNQGKVARYAPIAEYIDDYEFLVKNSLELPISLKLCKALNNGGMKIKPSLKIDDVVREICK